MRALAPPALQMMAAEVPQAICQKLPLDKGRRELLTQEDEDFEVEEVTLKKKLVKKEFGTATSTRPGM